MGHLYRHLTPDRAMFPYQTDLFTTFWRTAHWTWNRRATAKAAGMQFSEESITETILLELATRNPAEITIIPFNKRQEGDTGADWEWCFHDRDTHTFQPMLVQAKLLDDREQTYSHIDRFIGSTGVRQIDRLIQTSLLRQVPALYVFYNHLSDASRVPLGSCSCYGCLKCWGCSIALAPAVLASMSASKSAAAAKSFDELKRLSRPWVCLFCERAANRQPLPSRVLDTLRALSNLSQSALVEAGIPFDGPTLPLEPARDAPAYLELAHAIAASKHREEQEHMIEALKRDNPDINGIVLVEETHDPDDGD